MRIFSNFRYKLLSLVIAAFIWFVAQGQNDTERSFQIPVVMEGIPEELVSTDLAADTVSLRVRGSRAALANLEAKLPEYRLAADGAQPGGAEFRVDLLRLERELPRGARILSHSPSVISAKFEPRHSRRVRIRPELAGEPAEGFAVRSIVVEPALVQVAGARSEVLRISEVVTETVDIAGVDATLTREVSVRPGADHVWVQNPDSVRVNVVVEAIPAEEQSGDEDPS